MIRKGSRYPARLAKGAREVDVLLKGGRPIWMSSRTQRAVLKQWIDAHVTTSCVTVLDSAAHWMELEITLPGDFVGNPVDGWTGEMVAGKPPVTLGLFWSSDLASWTQGGWIAAPGKMTETLPDGRKKWFARYQTTPIWWFDVMVDLTASSDLYGKSVTEISVLGAPVSLPHYPYAMPSQAATLQADLRAAGYTGAVVSSVSGPLVATAHNHLSDGVKTLYVTMSGTNVTAVEDFSGPISLPSFPYSMPSQRAALQADLRAAGKSGAVVMLHGDTWTITLPNRIATGNNRPYGVTFSPGDPFPGYDFFGVYQGEAPANFLQGTSGNVRTPGGAPLQEAQRGFARVGFINLPDL